MTSHSLKSSLPCVIGAPSEKRHIRPTMETTARSKTRSRSNFCDASTNAASTMSLLMALELLTGQHVQPQLWLIGTGCWAT